MTRAVKTRRQSSGATLRKLCDHHFSRVGPRTAALQMPPILFQKKKKKTNYVSNTFEFIRQMAQETVAAKMKYNVNVVELKVRRRELEGAFAKREDELN